MMVMFLVVLSACGSNISKPETAQQKEPVADATNASDNKKTDNGKVVFKLAHTGALDDVMNKASLKLSELVKERTNGRIDIQVFGASQLGNERDILEGLQLGTIDMGLVSNGPLSGFEPMAGFWDLPYLYKDLEHAHAVANSDIAKELEVKLDEAGLHVLSINDGGFRHITNSKRPIQKIEDLNGIKIRVMESAIMKATFDAVPGMAATPLPFGELYSSLEQGVVEAQENPVTLIDSMKFNEVQDYLSLTGHFYYPRYFFMNNDKFKSLSKDDQDIIVTAAEEASKYNNEQNVALEKSLLTDLKEKGMKINEVDSQFKDKFQKIMIEKVYPAFYEKIGGTEEKGKEIIQKIQELGK